MISDDTEHACMTAQALIESGGDPDRFAHSLAWRLRWWVAALPAATGLATLKAGIKLWAGWSPSRSGVRSAGNGPCMRAPIIGLFAKDDVELVNLVRISSRLTHTDDRAVHGAIAVALAARMSHEGAADGSRYLERLRSLVPDTSAVLLSVTGAVAPENLVLPSHVFAHRQGMPSRVSGFVMHTVPVVLHAWLSNPRDPITAIQEVIGCGGDTDSTAALVSGIIGTAHGADLPSDLLERLVDWPRSRDWITRLGETFDQAATTRQPMRPPRVSLAAAMARNLVFAGIVLGHAARRTLPPYG